MTTNTKEANSPAAERVASGHSSGNAVAQALLDEFNRELLTTRDFLERIPESQLNWRPHDKSMTAGQLAFHMANVPAGVTRLSLADESPAPDFNAARQEAGSVHEILDSLDQSAAYVRQTLPTIDDERMRDTVKIVKDGRALISLPRGVFLRSLLLNHWYHHRGQLGVYLRLMGVSVPSCYGPSGDEPPRTLTA
jgi:uncharacterized damage-inducible protein DinB